MNLERFGVIQNYTDAITKYYMQKYGVWRCQKFEVTVTSEYEFIKGT